MALLAQKLHAVTRQATGGQNQKAIAAIENALLDMKGKALGVGVHALLGGAIREKLTLYWSHCGTYRINASYTAAMGLPQIRSLADIRELGRTVKEQGFKALKTNMFLFDEAGGEPALHMPGFGGTPGWPELNVSPKLIDAVAAQVEAFHADAGPDVGIHLDLNFNFKTEGYLQMTRALDGLGLT